MAEQRKTGENWLRASVPLGLHVYIDRFHKWNKGIYDWYEEGKKHYFALSIGIFALISCGAWFFDALGYHWSISSSLKQRIGCHSPSLSGEGIKMAKGDFEQGLAEARYAQSKQGVDKKDGYEKALGYFKAAHTKAPRFPELNSNYAAVLLQLNRTPEAEEYLQQEAKAVACLELRSDTQLVDLTAPYWDQATAARAREMIRQIKQNLHYNWACYHARFRREDQVIAELNLAIDSGFADAAKLIQDPDLNWLSGNSPRFMKIVKDLKNPGGATKE